MIQRRRIYEKALPSKDAQKIYVFCEGDDREKNYFDFFSGLSSNLEVIAITPYNHRSSPNNLMMRAEELFEGETPVYTLDYDQKDIIWFVVDTDEWEEQGLIKRLRTFCAEKNTGKNYKVRMLRKVILPSRYGYIIISTGPSQMMRMSHLTPRSRNMLTARSQEDLTAG